MNKYTYTDNKTGTVVLTLYADSILIADAQFLQTLGYKPEKNPFIGCSIASELVEKLIAEKKRLQEKLQYIRWQLRPELWDELVLCAKKKFPEGLI